MASSVAVSRPEVEAVRRFTRFYTRRLGVLREGLLASPYSLTEARLIYELAQRDGATASDLVRELDLDAGYVSRLLKGLESRGLIARRPSATDGRQTLVSLTAAGRDAFAELDTRSRGEVEALLAPLDGAARTRLVTAMTAIEELLDSQAQARPAYLLRPHRPGDIGWVIQRHAELYAEEYGWDGSFEVLVAEIAGAFLRDFDPARECCWIAERDGARVGSVFVARQSEEVAKLRMLLVEPRARGLGLGRRLVEEAIAFARRAGYRRMTLWTNDCLTAARRIYEGAGFKLVASEPHRSFGRDLVGETWALELQRPAAAPADVRSGG